MIITFKGDVKADEIRKEVKEGSVRSLDGPR
jgi:hypothetical protein